MDNQCICFMSTMSRDGQHSGAPGVNVFSGVRAEAANNSSGRFKVEDIMKNNCMGTLRQHSMPSFTQNGSSNMNIVIFFFSPLFIPHKLNKFGQLICGALIFSSTLFNYSMAIKTTIQPDKHKRNSISCRVHI